MNCPTCKQQRKERDFYWHKVTKTLMKPECKYCVSEKNKKINADKKAELNFAF